MSEFSDNLLQYLGSSRDCKNLLLSIISLFLAPLTLTFTQSLGSDTLPNLSQTVVRGSLAC
uniref:Uncharacterized protein n=1 Tax=Rhizophora mucronata TaxID=61149 RepID=A0A2P2PMF1_RHIMU